MNDGRGGLCELSVGALPLLSALLFGGDDGRRGLGLPAFAVFIFSALLRSRFTRAGGTLRAKKPACAGRDRPTGSGSFRLTRRRFHDTLRQSGGFFHAKTIAHGRRGR